MARAHTALAAALLGSALTVLPGAALGEGARDGKEAEGPEAPFAVVDLHVDIPWQVHFKSRSPTLTEGHARIDALRAGDYGAVVFPIYLPDKAHADGAHLDDAEAILATIDRILAAQPAFLPRLATSAEPGRITAFLSIEGAGAFASDVTRIDGFIERGLRLVSPVHSANGPLSSSATGAKSGHGLTPLGKAFCDRVYAHGALVDVSHASDRAFSDIATLAKRYGAPIVATHSNARAVADVPRNLTDAQLRLIGETGGVAGLNFHGPFVTTEGPATLDDVVAQALHMAAVAGVDHVAIGSDFDGGIRPPKGLEDAGKLPALARALRAKGMSHDDVLKIFSLNALRVLGWQPAKYPAP